AGYAEARHRRSLRTRRSSDVHLEGLAFTERGWVQSYGSRYVKPPIIYGDVVRPRPMTVEWIRYAQSLTDRPVKGMLTGPVTLLQDLKSTRLNSSHVTIS